MAAGGSTAETQTVAFNLVAQILGLTWDYIRSKAAQTIYNIVMFFVNRGSQVVELVQAITESISAIASGALGQAASLVESALAKALPVAIGFLALLIGVSGLARKVQNVVEGIRKRVDDAIEFVLNKAKQMAASLLRRLGIGRGEEGEEDEQEQPLDLPEVRFTDATGENHRMWMQESGNRYQLMVASGNPQKVEDAVEPDGEFADIEGQQETQVISQARQIEQSAKEVLENDQPTSGNIIESQMNEVATVLSQGGDSAIKKLIGEKLVERVNNGPDKKLVENDDIPGYALIQNDNRIYIQRRGGELEVHLDENGVLQEGASRPQSAEDAEKIAVYDWILTYAGLSPFSDIEKADEYREKMRKAVLAKHQSLTALNRILNAPASIIPSPYNGIRGKLFEEWCVANLGLVAPGPTFIDDRFSTEDRRRQADGVRVQGNMLIDAKVRQGGRPNTTDKSQMVDYNIIITNRLKSIETAGTANQPIYRGPFLTQCNTSSIIQNNLNFGTMIYKTDSVKTSLQCLSMTRQRNLTKRSDI